ncbi:TlyA family RNA methyltransferase [Vagococcus carniphilus]|uniref:TlyA family RNA methyltransferase n=1 Tax=Vagococcus carniphilus TaxID=218144 RepID=A0AAW8UA49_9ENTE|nr:TlyA family RNA methyltransferase [Vagococcus carniphilus]MDT2829874.1 TlyA family RNA methyltransferase [Vagococcus carniphilus]MDT2834861.1 TlyA family RNA methyltransferase [Vagococcus carniphilus]MDT2838308.1 TlyA family RNA methyltransferase [Vagococcus carniphilus]MDT2850009.1 TlyA family RNA methyltransferase [Vagococcus carniphilus]MDT2854304.1 TlyA family RNA methyltransferase [Vagococcus carniphilus]
MSEKKRKERVDVLVVQQGLSETREKAKRNVMAGLVVGDVDGLRYDKPGEKIPADTVLRLKGQVLPYVSRGGLKLEKAKKSFDINFSDKILLDIGSSTGGFTDVALQNGAKMSYALDVGSNQLAWKLRQDERVVVMEKTNFRYAKLEDFTKGQPEIATIDVSFISLKLILPVLKTILSDDGEVVALIKPQFEAGREQVGKKGIIRDRKVHLNVLKEVLTFIQEFGFDVIALDFSPITGGDGNIEFLAYLKPSKEGLGQFLSNVSPDEIVENSHSKLT